MNLTVFIQWDAKYPNTISSTTSMVVLDVGDKLCWRQDWDVGDRFKMMKIPNITKKNKNIMIRSSAQISHHHKVSNITMSSTSLSPGHFGHTYLLCFYISFGHQLSKKCHQNRNSIINIQKMSPTSSYQHRDFTNIIVIRSIYPRKTYLCTQVIGACF